MFHTYLNRKEKQGVAVDAFNRKLATFYDGAIAGMATFALLAITIGV